MSAHPKVLFALLATLSVPLAPAGAHVPFLRPQLSPLLGAAECVAAARVTAQEANPRGYHRVVGNTVTSWCGYSLPEPLSLTLPNAVPDGSWVVVFLTDEGGTWRVIGPPGLALPVQRSDFRVVHRSLARALYLVQRRDVAAESRRQSWWWLLQAQDDVWRFHAALELRAELDHGAPLSLAELALLRHLLQNRPNDPALRLLAKSVSSHSAK